ncbi:MAG: TrkH family potassium uptake protein [Hyphomonas sp.]|nr:TrkH family potassium uptake protein [Hyphomonas sp.]
MNYASVVRVLALVMLVLAASCLPAVLTGMAFGEFDQVFAFAAMAVGITVMASSILFLTGRPEQKARPSDALGLVILWWLASPVAACLPFLVGVQNDSVIAAIHEAAACLTTTGQSVIAVEGGRWPASLLVWRGTLHILGGAASMITAASVLAALNLGGPGIHRSVLFVMPESSFFDAVPKVARWVVIILGIGIAVTYLALLMTGMSAGRAISDAVSVWTTGLVDPAPYGRADANTFADIILVIGLCGGALGLAVALPLRDRKPLQALRDPEAIMFAVLVLGFGVAAMIGGLRAAAALGWSLSALATSGLPLSGGIPADSVPLPLLVLPALIGGSALSAAGGVKIARFIVLARRAGVEFRQLGYRRSILGFEFRNREMDERSVIGVWVYLIAYVLAVFGVMVLFTFTGLDFESAIRLAIGCLTNSGGMVSGHTVQLNDAASILAIGSMLLGRLEILAVIPAISVSFWRG